MFTKIDEQKLQSKFNRASWNKASDFMWTRIPDPVVQRQFKMLTLKGQANVPDSKLNEVGKIPNNNLPNASLGKLILKRIN